MQLPATASLSQAFSLLLFVAVSVTACSNSVTSKSADSAAATKRAFGVPCSADTECDGGLCLTSDYAPFAFCSAPCTVEEEPCPTADGSPSAGFCTRFPASFVGASGPVCLPLCASLTECAAKSNLWERCDPPSYKGQELYGATSGISVCAAPSSNGKPVVDAATCAGWSEAYRAEYATQVSICGAFCDFLASCAQLTDGASEDCCGYGCFQRMVGSDGEIDVPYEKLVKCYVTSYDSRVGTKTRCDAPTSDCGAAPVDPTPPK
jgi:hypothetical protein